MTRTNVVETRASKKRRWIIHRHYHKDENASLKMLQDEATPYLSQSVIKNLPAGIERWRLYANTVIKAKLPFSELILQYLDCIIECRTVTSECYRVIPSLREEATAKDDHNHEHRIQSLQSIRHDLAERGVSNAQSGTWTTGVRRCNNSVDGNSRIARALRGQRAYLTHLEFLASRS